MTMRKLIESTLVSLDGVIEAPERWANFDAESTAYSIEQLGNYDAFVMGRVTYEKFFANWGHTTGDPYLNLINAMPKYVASRSLTGTASARERRHAPMTSQQGRGAVSRGTRCPRGGPPWATLRFAGLWGAPACRPPPSQHDRWP